MALLKVIELMADSKKSWEDAAQQAVAHATKTVRNLKSVHVNTMSCTVDKNGKIATYRVNVSVSFEVD